MPSGCASHSHGSWVLVGFHVQGTVTPNRGSGTTQHNDESMPRMWVGMMSQSTQIIETYALRTQELKIVDPRPTYPFHLQKNPPSPSPPCPLPLPSVGPVRTGTDLAATPACSPVLQRHTLSAHGTNKERWTAREARTARGERWRGRGCFFCNLN
jgi:hypothetical protein